MLKKILVVVAVLIVALVIVVAMQPSDFRVSRTASIAAPADAVFPYVNDLHKFQEWSPWAKRDPNARITFTGPEAGKDASFSWAGNMQVGEGSMTVSESKPNDLVRYDLKFLKPFKGESIAEITLTPKGDQTEVTWSMSGKNNFVGKAMSLCMNCDKMIGGDFEKGFENLQTVLKGQATTTNTPTATL